MLNHPHGGHRKRLKNQYNVSGSEGMSDFTFLELMLFFAIPQSDTNPLAHRLIERFDSFDKVLDASLDELMSVKGIGEHAATYLTLYKEAMNRYNKVSAVEPLNLTQVDLVEKFIRSKYANMKEERTMLIHFNMNNLYLNHTWIGEGSFENKNLDYQKIAASVIENRSCMVIVVHNHPSGIARPSSKDMNVLRELGKFVRTLGVFIIDNAIITENDSHFFSDDPDCIDHLIEFRFGEQELKKFEGKWR